MFCIDNANKAKKSARSLEKFLAKSGVELIHGHALNAIAAMAGYVDWNAMLEDFKQAKPDGTKVPHILDIDFDKVDHVRVYGSAYEIEVDSVTLNALRAGDTELDDDERVLELLSVNDEVYSDDCLTIADLLDFKWDSDKQCFVNSHGQEFQAMVAQPYEFPSQSSVREKTSSEVSQADRVTPSGLVEVPVRFKVHVYCDEDFLGSHQSVGFTKNQAEAAALAELWDERIERYNANLETEELPEEEGGPFTVHVNGELIREDDSFDRIYRNARFLAGSDPSSLVEIKDVEDALILKFNK